ncbi:hypothetical protein KFK14_00785 [Sphingobium phenoxybenzoativorans]|uniref:Uncharacterized protein n=1 Tax=Sphingobium phenoxybenzoativorans TaxID=1592790 RepID=A0A975Q1W7_9SPHN|nr:hypothetical protein [Sphingobium phenoxybenzoativorans]QUT06071.1 hypothetical protein KFK14_00785 [Sphingobium phenoxybenzoativorans]
MTEDEILQRNLELAVALPTGWQALYRQLIHDVAEVDGTATVVQAKEKFGEMRVYLKAYSEPAFALTDAATARSRTLCQTCAEPAVLSRTTDGFYATVCSQHSEGFEPANFSPMRHVRVLIPKPDDDVENNASW